MSDDAKLIFAALVAVIIISLCLLGGCVANFHFTLEAAKIGLEPEGRGVDLRYVPTKQF